MTPTFVQGRGGGDTGGGSATTTALAYSSNVTAGNLLVVIGEADNLTGATMTDSQGNTWTATPLTPFVSVTNAYSVGIWYTRAGSSAANTVTLHTPSTPFRRLLLHEYSGADTFDADATADGASAASLSINIVLANANELVIAAPTWNNGAGSPGAGYTQREVFGSEFSEDQVFATSGTKAVTSTASPASKWQCIAAGFYQSGAAAHSLLAPHQINRHPRFRM